MKPSAYRKSSKLHWVLFLSLLIGVSAAIPNRVYGQIVWSGLSGTDTKWSTPGNWTGGLVPTNVDAVLFGDGGTDATVGNVNNTVDGLFAGTVLSLRYAQANQLFHTTLIEPGKALTVLGNLIVGSEVAQPSLVVNFTGAGGALVVTNEAADFVVRQGGDTVSSRATLDLSGLDSLNVDVNRVIIGRADPSGYANVNRNTGWLYLARTNRIRAVAANTSLNVVAIEVGRSGSNNGNGSRLYLGQTNVILASSLSVGMEKESGCQMLFNPLFTDRSVFIRGADGISRMGLWTIGDGESNSGTTSCQGTVDLTGGAVDARVDSMTVGRASSNTSGTGNSRGTITMDRGELDVNTLQAGLQSANTGKNGVGIVNVNGGILRVNTVLELGHGTGGAGLATTVGRLSVNGGTVLANQIVCGIAGSEISVGSGTLITSNQLGTVAAPVGTLTLSNSILPLPVSGASAPIIVSNLVTSGTQNTVNISSLPPIAQYPATLPLINYQGGAVQGSGNNFVLGSMPSGTPPFQGRLVDNGTSIALELTTGPITDLKCIWTGGVDSNWDMATLNWINKGIAAAFVPNGDAYFLDSAPAGEINLAQPLSPTSITVSNNIRNYTLAGPGRIVGADRLIKDGTGPLVIANQGTNVLNSLTVKAGTLQLGDGGTNGSLATLAITNNSALVVDRNGTSILTAPISGLGSITKRGAGLLNLTADSSYTGETLLQAGALAVNGWLSGGGKLTSAAGTILTGSGNYLGPVQSSGMINPGALNGFGWLRLSGNLTVPAGGVLAFDLSGSSAAFDPSVNDALEVDGTLTLNNTTIRVNLSGIPQVGAPYMVMTHGGIASGSFNPTVTGTHYQTTLDATSSPGVVYVTFNSTTGIDLRWASTSSGAWDADAVNWVTQVNNQPSAFYPGDTALLDDTQGVVTNLTIGAGVTITTAGITNRSDVNNFVISGAGRISGSGAIQKEGTSILAISTPNDFTGPVVALNGTLRTGSATALGTTTSGTFINPGATLDVNGQNLGQEQVTVGGAGVQAKGAIVNSGPDQTQALRLVKLTADTVFGGTGRWDIRNGTLTLDSSVVSPVKITKVGTNQFSFVATTIPGLLGDVDVQEGIFAIQTTTAQLSINANGAAFGDPARTVTVRSNATLNLYALGVDYPLNKAITLHGGAILWNDSGTCVLNGPVTLLDPVTVNVDGGTILNITSAIGGPGGMIKDRTGALTLGAVNSYSGSTVVAAGSLSLPEGSSIASSKSITIVAGATLDVSNRVDGTLTLGSPQTLGGSGNINGSLLSPSGTTLAPGAPLGSLTVSGGATLGGSTLIAINAGATPNCGNLAASAITYGGALVISNAGPALTSSAAFKLFSSSSGNYGARFAAIQLPELGPGLSWDTNQLAATGTLLLTGTLVAPVISSISVQSGQIVVNGTAGGSGGNYYVLTSTNLALPISGWTYLSTNAFLSNGNFTFTDPLVPDAQQRFYLIMLP